MLRYILILIITIFAFSLKLSAQSDAGVKMMPKQGDIYDEVKKLDNPYSLPLGAKKLGKRGFLLPYPIGVMVNGYMGSQDVSVSNLSVGLNDGEMMNLDNVVGFSEVKASVHTINMRTDIWVLPFLDVYGIVGMAAVETGVGIGSIAQKPVDFSTQANFDGYVYGVGAMLTGGIRSIFFALDFNKVWTHFDELANDNTAMTLSPRVGYIFHLNNEPEKNISVWTGAGRVFLNNTTEGRIGLSEVLPNFGQNYQNTDWYNNLPNLEKTFVDKLVTKAGEHVATDQIHYSLEKRPTKNWSMILGAQFQLDRHWQFRVESNFFGGRQSGLISANYRFGFF